MAAVACIIQAIPDASKLQPLGQLLTFLENDRKEYAASFLGPRDQPYEVYAKATESVLLNLRCLAKIGFGLRAPNDQPIDLDADFNAAFWTQEHGLSIQLRILDIVFEACNFLDGNVGEIVEEACEVFRAGFTEQVPGPFVFSPPMVCTFLTKFHVVSTQMGTLVKTACLFLTSCDKWGPDADQAVQDLLNWALVI